MERQKYNWQMSANCRVPAATKRAFLDWLNSRPEFRRRRPTPKEVIAEARRKNSPIRCVLEHNLELAAERYWYNQAQYLLRHVEVVRIEVRTGEALTRPVRAYIPVRITGRGRQPNENYVPAPRVAVSPQLKVGVLQRAHRDFLAWLTRFERYAEFLDEFNPVISAYRKIEAQHDPAAKVAKAG